MKQLVINVALTFALVLGSLMTTSVSAQESELTVIGNIKSVPSEMDSDHLKKVLRGEQLQWDDGTKVVIVLMRSKTPTGAETYKRLYNMTPKQFSRYFRLLVYKGEGNPPQFCETTAQMETVVSSTPGAIGVVSNSNSEAVQIINIDGKKSI
jgi:hypothetical protein